MNEMKMVRELLKEPPSPSRDVAAEALRRLENDITGPASRTAPRRRPRKRLGLVIAPGLVAAGAAAALIVATGGQGTPVAPRKAPTEPPSARQILLAAAQEAAKEPTGRYLRVRSVRAGASHHVGSAEDGYVVSRRTEADWWQARSDSDADVQYLRDLGTSPATAEDVAAWREAGSPRTWQIRGEDGHRLTVSTRTGRWEVGVRTTPAQKKDRAEREAKICAASPGCAGSKKAGFRDMSWEQQERVASDPTRLKALLFPWLTKEAQVTPRVRREAPPSSANELSASFEILTNHTSSPKLRAAIFKLLAEMPGVRPVGTVRDLRGRTGIALAARGTTLGGADGVFDYQLILDPKTHRILGDQRVVVRAGDLYPGMRPGTVVDRSAIQGPDWTNETPHPG